MSKDFNSAIKERRSIYTISDKVHISDKRIEEIIEEVVKYSPTAFNSQNGRVVLLLNDKHDRLWDITEDALRKEVPEDKFKPTEEKIESFRSGYGTILYFIDQSVVESLQEQFALYKDNFPIWAQQSSGILQNLVWTALSIEGLGASLQHYNELIEEDVRKEWNIPGNWSMVAQMPFGNKEEEAGEKEFLPINDRFKVFK